VIRADLRLTRHEVFNKQVERNRAYQQHADHDDSQVRDPALDLDSESAQQSAVFTLRLCVHRGRKVYDKRSRQPADQNKRMNDGRRRVEPQEAADDERASRQQKDEPDKHSIGVDAHDSALTLRCKAMLPCRERVGKSNGPVLLDPT
jgi:hypothetical protein